MIHLPYDGIRPHNNPCNVYTAVQPTGQVQVRCYRAMYNRHKLTPFSYELWRIMWATDQLRRKGIPAEIYYEDRIAIPSQKVEIDNIQVLKTVQNLKRMISPLHRTRPEDEGKEFHELEPWLQEKVEDGRLTGEIFLNGKFVKVGPRSYNDTESYRDKDIKFSRWSIWE